MSSREVNTKNRLACHRKKVVKAMEVVTGLLMAESAIEKIQVESNSAWLCVDIWPYNPFVPAEMCTPEKFAIWLNTSQLFKVDQHGAAMEDPITVEEAIRGLDTR
jgi:hypothetical protein